MRHIKLAVAAIGLTASLCSCATNQESKETTAVRNIRNQQALQDAQAGREALQHRMAQQREQERFIERREGRTIPR